MVFYLSCRVDWPRARLCVNSVVRLPRIHNPDDVRRATRVPRVPTSRYTRVETSANICFGFLRVAQHGSCVMGNEQYQ